MQGQGGSPIPEWAQMMKADEFRRFQQHVIQGIPPQYQGGEINWEEGIMKVDKLTIGFHNLVQWCAGCSDKQVASEVQSFFQKLGDLTKSGTKEPIQFSQLKLYLVPPDIEHREGVFQFSSPKEFRIIVAIDSADSISWLTVDSRQDLAVDERELYHIALENVLKNEECSVHATEIEGSMVYVATGDSFFVATRIMDFSSLIAGPAPDGIIFGVPNRHTAIFHRLGDGYLQPILSKMAVMAQEQYRDGPGSISPYLFWWKAGRIETLYFGDENLQSDEYFEMLGNYYSAR